MKNSLKKLICVTLLLLTLTACKPETLPEKEENLTPTEGTTIAEESIQIPIDNKTYTAAELKDDFNQLKTLINSVHPKLYADMDDLNKLADANYERIEEGMTELEFLRLLTPIVSKLNCGHTSINHSSSYDDTAGAHLKLFPLGIRFIDNRAYVTQNKVATQIPLQSEILSINGMSVQSIKDKIFENRPADGHNQTVKQHFINFDFRALYYDFVESTEVYTISYYSPTDAEALSVTLNGINDAEYQRINQPPLPETDIAYASEFQKTYAILQMKAFYPYGTYTIAKYKAFMDAFFLEVKEKNINHVILDLRDNSGGDPYVSSHLFSYLEKAPHPYFAQSANDHYRGLKEPIPLAENHYDGNLYILMNGRSFSSTGHLLALLKYHKRGIFIGEESGGSFACTDSSNNNTLKNTKIQYYASTQVWEVATEGLTPGRGIMPDHEISQSIEDYMFNIDTVKDFAVKLILN